MKWNLIVRSTILTLATIMPMSFAQDVKRVVVLPFNTTDGFEAYRLGLASALQRSFNVIDTVYVPPISDTITVTQRLLASESLTVDNVVKAFDADIVISGQLSPNGNNADILIGLTGPDFPEVQNISLLSNLNQPSELVRDVTDAVLARLTFNVTQTDRDELSTIVTEVPSLPSLNAVADASFRSPVANLSNLDAANQLDGDSSWVATEYARSLALSGQLDPAEATAKLATELAFNDVEAWFNYGVLLRSAGKQSEATAIFQRALEINPVHAPSLVGLASMTQDVEQAKADLEQAINIYPRFVDAYLQLAELESADFARSLQIIRRGAVAVPESTALHQAFMQLAINAGDASGAASYLLETISNQPNPSPGLFGLASLLPSSLADEGLVIIQLGRNQFPNNSDLIIAEAEYFERQGSFLEAESALQNAMAANQGNADLINRLAIVQAKQGNLDAARETFALLGTENSTAQFNLAQLYLEAGENAAAATALESIIQAGNADSEIYAFLGISKSRDGRYQEALSAFDQALALDGTNSTASQAKAQLEEQIQVTGGQRIEMSNQASTLFSQGQAALGVADYEQAARLFAEARSIDDNGLLGFYEGLANYFNSQPRQAVAGYQKALESFPNSDIIHNNLGLAQLELGRFDLALESLGRAIQINASNDQAHLNLGLAHYRLNDFAAAVSDWETALNLNPNLNDTVADLLADARSKQ